MSGTDMPLETLLAHLHTYYAATHGSVGVDWQPYRSAPEPQALAPGFAATTARLGQQWLENLPTA